MKTKILLSLILSTAFILRFWALGSFPAGFNADEAALGYNAYSILHTGKDEYGTPLPLIFKSFGDFKPGLYVYLAFPFVVLMGLNEAAVRFPSLLFGVATVGLVFLLGRKIFKSETVGLLSALLLAISPWHIHFSRGAWETNVATFFITLGVYLFIKALEARKYWLWSAVSFLASMYTYQSPRLVIPVFLIILLVIYRQVIVKNFKTVSKAVAITALIAIPLVLQFTSGAGSSRFSGLSFFADPGPVSRTNELRGEHQFPSSFDSQLIHNKLTAYGISFIGHYLDHFTPNFLFINGDPLIRNKVPEAGQFYLVTSIFLIFGLIYLIRNKVDHSKLLVAWILVAPIASSMTYQTPHALRALNMVIPLTLLMGFGLYKLVTLVKGKLRYLLIGVICIFIVFELTHYLESYYVHYPKRYPLAWEYGFKEMVTKLEKYEDNYNKVVITDRYDQPYILVLFFKQYDPMKYQPQAVLSERDKFNFGTVRSFDKYEFRSIKQEELNTPGVLYVGTGEEIPQNAKMIDEVNFPNGEPAFIFAQGGS